MEKETIKIPGWRIIRTIGKGGFGYVYEVEKEDDFSGGVHSALKVVSIPDSQSEIADLRMEGYDDQSMTELFRSHVEDITSEFRLMSKLKGCSNIVSFEDYSVVQHDNDPGYDVMIRMELLTPLPEYIYRHYEKEPITDALVRKIGTDICNALELCHECSIIHRDIKPQNIFVNAYGSFKLGDFGIAKTSDHTTRATKTGTFGYMAPEVYLSKPYNASVDIYSLGLVMYWMLNERRGPFLPLPPAVPKPSQNAEALDRRMSGEPLPVPKHGSEELKRIVLKACAFDPKDRYTNPTEMKRDLERLTIRTDTEAPHTETEQASISFSADEDEKTFGVFGGKPSKPEVPPTEEDEKTFGIFGTRQAKEPEFIPVDSEATVSAKKAAPMKPAEKPVEHKKEIKPVEPKKEIKPVKTEPEQKEQPVQAEAKPVETKSRKKSKLPVILSIAAALVIAAVVLIVVLAGKGKTPSQTAEQPTPAPTATTATVESIPTETPVISQKTTEKPVEEKATVTPKPDIWKFDVSQVEIGSIIRFGSYEQDNDLSNGKEDIEWIVLAKDGSTILMISRYGLANQPFHSSNTTVKWENCTLRSWLNDSFFNEAFSNDEQRAICVSNVLAHRNPSHDNDPGNETEDRVFLLSIYEAEKYFRDREERKCKPTAYVIATSKLEKDENCWWWLRSPGADPNDAAIVSASGVVGKGGYDVSYKNAAVRPVIQINLDW